MALRTEVTVVIVIGMIGTSAALLIFYLTGAFRTPIDYTRNFDPETEVAVFLDETYDLKPMVSEVKNIYEKVSKLE